MIIRDIDDALFLVTRIVTTVLGKDVGLAPDDIDIDLTFTDAKPDGYGRTHLRYLALCSSIEDQVRTSSGREFYYQVAPFLLDHEGKPIKVFIVDSAKLLLRAPASAHAGKIAAWTATSPAA